MQRCSGHASPQLLHSRPELLVGQRFKVCLNFGARLRPPKTSAHGLLRTQSISFSTPNSAPQKKPAGGWRLFVYLSFRLCVLGILACHSCSLLHVCECGLNQFLSRSWTTLLWVWSSPYFHLECFVRLARVMSLSPQNVLQLSSIALIEHVCDTRQFQ